MQKALKISSVVLCFMNCCSASVEWSAVSTIYAEDGVDVEDFAFAVHPDNRLAAIAWVTNTSGSYQVAASSSLNGVDWESPSFISSSSSQMPDLLLKMDSQGNAHAIWSFYDGSHFTVQTAQFQENVWSSAQSVVTLGSHYFESFLDASINQAGYIALKWQTEAIELQAMTYNPLSTEWSSPYLIGSDSIPAPAQLSSSLAIDEENNLSSFLLTPGAFWLNERSSINLSDPSTTSLLLGANGFDPTSLNVSYNLENHFYLAVFQFQASVDLNRSIISATNYIRDHLLKNWDYQVIATPQTHAVALETSMNPNGNWGAAVWKLDTQQIQTTIFDGINWQTPYSITETGTSPSIAINQKNNHILLAWGELSTGNIEVIEYDGKNWGEPQIVSVASAFVDSPKIMIDSQGHAIIAWKRLNGSNILLEAITSLDTDS